MPRTSSGMKGDRRSSASSSTSKFRSIYDAIAGLHIDAADTILRSLKTNGWRDLIDAAAYNDLPLGYRTPQIVPSERCWIEDEPPTDHDVMTTVLEECEERNAEFKKQSGRKGRSKTEDKLPYFSKEYQGRIYNHTEFFGHLFIQLQNPNATSRKEAVPLKLTDIDLDNTECSKRYVVPEKHLGITVSGAVELTFQCNIGLKGADIDPHMDHGASVLSLVFGSCKKLWCVWPPTPENFDILTKMRSGSSEAMKHWGRLRDGAIGILDSSHAIYLPPGWIHATIALTPGLLAGRAFFEPGCAPTSARCLIADIAVDRATGRPNVRAPSEALITLEGSYRWSLCVDFLTRDSEIRDAALQSWFAVQDELALATDDGLFDAGRLQKSSEHIHTEVRKTLGSIVTKDKGTRPCPMHERSTLTLQHFFEEHVRFLRNVVPRTHKRKRSSASSQGGAEPGPRNMEKKVIPETPQTSQEGASRRSSTGRPSRTTRIPRKGLSSGATEEAGQTSQEEPARRPSRGKMTAKGKQRATTSVMETVVEALEHEELEEAEPALPPVPKKRKLRPGATGKRKK